MTEDSGSLRDFYARHGGVGGVDDASLLVVSPSAVRMEHRFVRLHPRFDRRETLDRLKVGRRHV
jgi:hypothetical protein